MKKFIAVIGVAGSGKTTFINKNFPSLPVEELNDDTCEDLILFNQLIRFDKAVLHITGFEDIVGEILFDKILKNFTVLFKFIGNIFSLKVWKI